MDKAYSHAKTALAHANAAITVTRKAGLGYPTNTYVDLLYAAALALGAFMNKHKNARPVAEAPPALE